MMIFSTHFFSNFPLSSYSFQKISLFFSYFFYFQIFIFFSIFFIYQYPFFWYILLLFHFQFFFFIFSFLYIFFSILFYHKILGFFTLLFSSFFIIFTLIPFFQFFILLFLFLCQIPILISIHRHASVFFLIYINLKMNIWSRSISTSLLILVCACFHNRVYNDSKFIFIRIHILISLQAF